MLPIKYQSFVFFNLYFQVFDHTNSYPLTGRLTNIPAFYTISYICQDGNRVEVDDDEKTLSELNIKLPFIKMNKHVTNRRNTETQKNIGKYFQNKCVLYKQIIQDP